MKTTILHGIDDHRDTLMIVAFLAAIVGGALWAKAEPAAPEPVTIIVTPTLAPLRVSDAPGTGGPRLPRAVVAYAAPGGAVLGALEPGRVYRPVARYGVNWVQIDAEASGMVWIDAHAAGVPVEASLPDLAPRATPEVIYVSAPVAMPEAAPAPTIAATPGLASELPPGVDPLAGCCEVSVRLP